MLRVMLTVNTAHVTHATMNMLSSCKVNHRPGDKYGFKQLLTRPYHYVIEELDAVNMDALSQDYPDLHEVIKAAQNMGADVLCLDGDAKPFPGLPFYEN